MDRREKAQELIEQSEKLGVRLESRGGLIVAVKQTSGHPERQDAVIKELVRRFTDVRPLVERRAMAAYASELLGARILYPEFSLMEVTAMEGELESASGDGAVTISVIKEGFRHPKVLMTARAENLLIVLDEEEADGAASPENERPKSQQPLRRLFDRLRGPRES